MPLTAPAWLSDGDEIALGPGIVTIAIRDGLLTLEAPAAPAAVQGAAVGTDGSQARRFGARFGAAAPSHKRKATAAKGIAAAIFAVLFIGVAYVLTASGLRLQITPEPDSLSISGLVPVIPVGDRYLAFPGEYVLEARKEGYRPLSHPISVSYGAASTFELALQKLRRRCAVRRPRR
jgi:hypothetical protein